MAEPPRRVDLRLTIPASAPYAGVAGEVASRFAAYSGASGADAARLGDEVEALLAHLGGRAGDPVEVEMAAGDTELTVTATARGLKERTICPLPDAHL